MDVGVVKQGDRYVISHELEDNLYQHNKQVARLSDGSVKISLNEESVFRPGSAELDYTIRSDLDHLAYVLRNYSGFSVLVIDRVQAEHPGLSQERAHTVGSYLISRGLSPHRVRTESPNNNHLALDHSAHEIAIVLKPSL